MTKKQEVETKEVSNSTAALAQQPGNTINPTQDEQPIMTQIQLLWPNARKSGKALGEQLSHLRDLCKESGNRFDLLCQTLGIPRSTAYHFISIYEELVIADFTFPANAVRFAIIAGINLSDMGHRTILYEAFRDADGPPEPTDAQAISIVGSASTAVAQAKAASDEAPVELTARQKAIAGFDQAFVTAYKTLTKATKVGSVQRAAAEEQYVSFARQFIAPELWTIPKEMFQLTEMEDGELVPHSHRSPTQPEKDRIAANSRTALLALGRGQTTLAKLFNL